MLASGVLVFVTADLMPKFFSSNIEVIEYGSMYLKISAFILPAYPIFFLSNGFFMALKKAENALIANICRNGIFPFVVFYTAIYFNSDFSEFFWLWVIFNWIFSLMYLGYTYFYLNYKLDKIRAIN